MPELPDLEIFRGNIFSRLSSKTIKGLQVHSQKITTPQIVLAEELVGRTLIAINRHGKELLFDFADERIISAHLMMNGRVAVVDNAPAADKVRSKVLSLDFENESIIFHDTGNLGAVIKYKPIFANVPDALAVDFTLDYFTKIAGRKASTNIKAFLIDQKVVRGIGNAYADEILWHARVSPKSVTGRLPREALEALYHTIGIVLREAIESIRTIAPDIISGEERSFLKVHNRLLKQTTTGFPIKKEMIATKWTCYTDEQVVY